MSYCIVSFHAKEDEEEDEVAVVNRNWICGQKCYWPSYVKDSRRLQNLVLSGAEPNPSSWELYDMHVVQNRFYDSYDEARIHLKDSEKGSDWSDQEQMSTNSRLRRRDNFVPGLSTNVSDCHAPKKRRTDQQPIPPVPPDSLINNSFVFPAPMNTATLVGVTYHENDIQGLPISGTLGEPQSFFNLTNNEGVSNPVDQSYTQTRCPASSNREISSQSHPFNPSVGEGSRFGEVPQSRMSASYCSNTNSVNSVAGTPQSDQLSGSQSGNIRGLASAVKDLQNNQLLLGAKLDMALDMLRVLVDKAGSGKTSSSFESRIDLPISTIPAFIALEKDMLADRNIKESLIVMLKCKGGENHNQITYRVMAALMTDELMCEFTFVGQTGKQSFKSSIFLQCVCDAVRQNVKGSVASDKEIEKAVDYWLRKASNRIKKRNEKKTSRNMMDAQ